MCHWFPAVTVCHWCPTVMLVKSPSDAIHSNLDFVIVNEVYNRLTERLHPGDTAFWRNARNIQENELVFLGCQKFAVVFSEDHRTQAVDGECTCVNGFSDHQAPISTRRKIMGCPGETVNQKNSPKQCPGVIDKVIMDLKKMRGRIKYTRR